MVNVVHANFYVYSTFLGEISLQFNNYFHVHINESFKITIKMHFDFVTDTVLLSANIKIMFVKYLNVTHQNCVEIIYRA